MTRIERIAEASTPDGSKIVLAREGAHLVVRCDRLVLMSSALHGSEKELASLTCSPLAKRKKARVLVGGLGMGFTLRAALDHLGEDAQVVVTELVPALVEWNRGPLAELANSPLDDPRCALETVNLVAYLQGNPGKFHAILLDVDNGPDALTTRGNEWLYGRGGLRVMKKLLEPGGTLAVWSAYASPKFEERVRETGFRLEVVRARARGAGGKGARHPIYLAKRSNR